MANRWIENNDNQKWVNRPGNRQRWLSKIERAELESIVALMTYESYKNNRKANPALSPFQWVAIYGWDALLYEMRYQEEMKNG